MSKYKVLTTWRLRAFLRDNTDIYTPDGNRPFVVSNGILGGQLIFDPKTNKVYGLCMKELEANEKFIEQCIGQMSKELVAEKMSYKQAKEWLAAQAKELKE